MRLQCWSGLEIINLKVSDADQCRSHYTPRSPFPRSGGSIDLQASSISTRIDIVDFVKVAVAAAVDCIYFILHNNTFSEFCKLCDHCSSTGTRSEAILGLEY